MIKEANLINRGRKGKLEKFAAADIKVVVSLHFLVKIIKKGKRLNFSCCASND